MYIIFIICYKYLLYIVIPNKNNYITKKNIKY